MGKMPMMGMGKRGAGDYGDAREPDADDRKAGKRMAAPFRKAGKRDFPPRRAR